MRLSISLMKFLYKDLFLLPKILTRSQENATVGSQKTSSSSLRPTHTYGEGCFSGRPTGKRSHIQTERPQTHPPMNGFEVVFLHVTSSCNLTIKLVKCNNRRVGGVLFVGIHEHTTMLNEYLHNLLPDGISRRAQQTPICTSRPSRPRSQETSKEQRLQSSLQRPPVIGGATRTLEHTAPRSPHWLLQGIPTYDAGAKGMGRRLSCCQSFPGH